VRKLLIMLALALAASAARAGATLESLAPSYQESPAAEVVAVRVSDALGAVTETVAVWTDPDRGTAALRLGPLVAHLTRKTLIVEREGDPSRAFVARALGSPARALAEHLPGVPAPQVALSFGEPDAPVWPLAEPGASATLFATPEGRLRFATIDLGSGRRVTLTVDAASPDEAPGPAPAPEELATRRLVSSVAVLAEPPPPASRLVRAGDDAPEMLLLGIDMRPWILGSRDAGAVAVVLCRTQTPGAGAGYGAALDVAERDDAPLGFTPILGVCGEPFDRPLLDHLRDLRNKWGSSVMWTVSPETTIDRFAPEDEAVLVVIDALDSVRAVIPLDGRGADQPLLEREIIAALGLHAD